MWWFDWDDPSLHMATVIEVGFMVALPFVFIVGGLIAGFMIWG